MPDSPQFDACRGQSSDGRRGICWSAIVLAVAIVAGGCGPVATRDEAINTAREWLIETMARALPDAQYEVDDYEDNGPCWPTDKVTIVIETRTTAPDGQDMDDVMDRVVEYWRSLGADVIHRPLQGSEVATAYDFDGYLLDAHVVDRVGSLYLTVRTPCLAPTG